MASPFPVPDARAVAAHPDHHLWRNGRLWWIAFTIHRGHVQERVRHSLGTADLGEARARRDEVLGRYARAPDCRLALRIESPRARAARRGLRSLEGGR